MPPTTRCRRGDIVLVPFPFTDLSTTKQRPAVILSSEEYHQTTGDCIVAAITSVRPSALSPGEIVLSLEDQAAGGLLKPSVVKVGKLIALDRRLIRRTLGRLPEATVETLLVELKRFLIEP
ncbi:MAG: type II toxin-antitoxin system PemK/MazF family toxin [Candidatus Rokubacteria bacterium]|nr:type II toxin-antitoxin system PemK/MazF family toxin [Candidatus Rokubacteria bacterium]